MEISASAYRHRHRHWHRHRHSNINIVFYISLHVISNKVATYRLEACDFVRKCFAKLSGRKFSDNLKRVTVKKPYEKTSALESLFNEIAGINSRLASLVKKSLNPRHLPVILELLALLQEGLTWALFFSIKLRAAYCRVATLFRSWSTIDFFLKILFFKTASFRYIFQKVSVMRYLHSKIAAWTL